MSSANDRTNTRVAAGNWNPQSGAQKAVALCFKDVDKDFWRQLLLALT
jgi:hypothetical protein